MLLREFLRRKFNPLAKQRQHMKEYLTKPPLRPQVNFGFLPFAMSESVNGTIGLRLRAEVNGKVQASHDLEANAGAGAYIILAEVTVGEVASTDSSCEAAIFAEVDANMGAYATAGATFGIDSFTAGPSVSTTYLSMGTTICLATETPTFVSTSMAPEVTDTVLECAVALTEETTTITSSYSLTSCVISAVNCPSSLTQVIIVTNIESVITTLCPATTYATTTSAATPTANAANQKAVAANADAIPITVAPAALSSLIPLQAVQSPIIQTLDVHDVSSPTNSTIIGSFVPISVATPSTSTTLVPSSSTTPGKKTNLGSKLGTGNIWLTLLACVATLIVLL